MLLQESIYIDIYSYFNGRFYGLNWWSCTWLFNIIQPHDIFHVKELVLYIFLIYGHSVSTKWLCFIVSIRSFFTWHIGFRKCIFFAAKEQFGVMISSFLEFYFLFQMFSLITVIHILTKLVTEYKISLCCQYWHLFLLKSILNRI